MSAHTPGPWVVTEIGTIEDGSHNPYQIAAVNPNNRDANARLIAAAPELLEACKAALDGLYSYRAIEGNCSAINERDKLALAIAKAEGQS